MARVQVKEDDSWRWLSVSEESLLLHNDLLHLVGHISLPSGVGESVPEEEYGLPVLDGKTPEELVDIITRECSVRSTTYSSLVEYRFNALKGLWEALLEREKKPADKKQDDSPSGGSAKSSHKGEGFASRVSLVLIFPVLKSLCKLDPKLSQETAGLLLESLQACEPLSLSSEPSDCINGLESLLCSWLKSAKEDEGLEGDVRERQLQTAASALVALAVAVGTGGLLLRTVHTLQSLEASYSSHVTLIVPKILHKLLMEHIVLEEPPALAADTHLMCWGYEDQKETSSEGVVPRSVVFDGDCLYVTMTTGKELLKLGTGTNGTLRGYVYTRSKVENGWVVYVEGCDNLLYRKTSSDEKQDQPFLIQLDRSTLKEVGSVKAEFPLPSEPHATLHTISDGCLLYWIYYLKNQDVIHPVTGEKVKQHLVYLQILQIEERESSQFFIVSKKERILLSKPSSDDPRMSTDVMKSLMRSGSSYASLSALLGGSKDDQSTSCGLGLKQIQAGSAYCTGSSLVLVTAPPPNSGSRSLFGVSGASSKALCLSFSYSLSTGSLVTQSELPASAQLHCGLSKGGSIQTLALSYDHLNHCLLSVTEQWIDVWTCVGKVKPAAHILALRMGKSLLEDLIPKLPDSDTISIPGAVQLLLRHSGIESCRLTPGKDYALPVAHSLSLSFLEHCCSIMEYSIDNHQVDNCLSTVITLQAVLPAYLRSKKYPQESISTFKTRIRTCISKLLEMEGHSQALYKEVKKLICQNCGGLYLDEEEVADQFVNFLTSSPNRTDLMNELLVKVASNLRRVFELSPSILRLRPIIGNALERDSLVAIETIQQGDKNVLLQPMFSPILQCAAAILNLSLRSLTGTLTELKSLVKKQGSEEETERVREKMEKQGSVLMEVCEKLRVFESCEKILEKVIEVGGSLCVSEHDNSKSDTEGEGGLVEEGQTDEKVQSSLRPCDVFLSLEKSCKGSVLGALLPPLLTVLSDGTICSLPLATHLLGHLAKLGRLNAEACSMLYKGYRKIKVPAPWASGRVIETIHPVRDNYKFKETVSFPGAKHLYLKFDPRCSSQYDYDKVIVFAGDSTSSPKVAEYGGNTHGFGSRSVLGKGWPKDLVKVDGDKVTFSFEMKSGREHSTPDKAMWGFCCIVRPQEVAEDSPSGLPFLLDLYLSLSSVSCSLISQLFNGAPPTADEIKCASLMQSSLLQRCVWTDDPSLVASGSSVSQTSLLPEVLQKIRVMINKPRPTLRKSISEILKVDLLEDVILSACLKHHGILSPITVTVEKDIEQNRQLLEDIFTHINGLERRFQVLAELESNWWSDVEQIAGENLVESGAFYHELHQQESSVKNFELLCCLMGVEVTGDHFSAAKELGSLLERDVQQLKQKKDIPLNTQAKVSCLVNGVLERSRLLLQVSISVPATPHKTTPPSYISRSVSVPAHRFDSMPLRRQRSDGNYLPNVASLLIDSSPDTREISLLEEIFQFIGTKPEEAVSSSSFLSAASQQQLRAIGRRRALEFLQSLLTTQQLGATVEHILACVGGVLQNGPHVTDIACSGQVTQVRDAFADVMHAVVEMASRQPASCISTIALLSIIPYTREEESCLVRSGLVKLLDHLCSLSDLPQGSEGVREGEGEEEGEALQRVTALAWAAFQVLAERCVSWETRSVGFISSGLAQQVSLLLTNHLSRAMDSLVASESGTSDTLQEALSMLLGLARSHMGRTILSQPACVSKLLLLLTDQRPSPKLVLIALQLCRIALPLMTIAECSQVTIPPHPTFSSSLQTDNLASNIITLLMAKLAEYLVPSVNQTSSKQIPDEDLRTLEESTSSANLQGGHDEIDESGQASVYIHKRSDETASELLQHLLNQDPRHRMESILHLDGSLSHEGKAEIYTDTYRACFRRAVRWANMGFLVSIEPPVGGNGMGPSGTESDVKKAKAESACKKKNLDLLKMDPPRPFLSGTVAYSLASEIIALLNGLLADPGAAQVWKKAIQNVLKTSLTAVPTFLPQLEKYCQKIHTSVRDCVTPPSPENFLSVACLANATFAALGGFKDTIRPNMKVQVSGDGIEDCQGTVVSISERRGIANVHFSEDKYCFGANQTLEVPLCRLHPPEIASLPLNQLDLQKDLCDALVSLVSTCGPMVSDPHSGMDASLPSMGLCRLFAELRTRAFMSLDHHVKSEEFRDSLLDNCDIIQFMKQAETCQPGERLSVVETHCMGLRMLYRDCARPPPPKVEKNQKERTKVYLDIGRSWPPIRSCSFSHHMTSVVYQGPTTSTGGSTPDEEAQDKPKGAFILTTTPIHRQAPSFYWEVELTQVDTGSNSPHLTMGYCPDVKKVEGREVWSYPDGTCLLRSSGRGCQVLGDDRMKWKKINLDSPLKTGDVMGCGWIKEDTPDTKGLVYFTVNGTRIQQNFKDAPPNMYPFLHLQKKGIKVRANFGDRPFSYPEGHDHRDAADVLVGDSLEEIVALFKELPFHPWDDDDEEPVEEQPQSVSQGMAAAEEEESGDQKEVKHEPLVVGPPPKDLEVPKLISKDYSYKSSSSLLHPLRPSFDTMLESGPLIRPGGSSHQEEEEEEEGETRGVQAEGDLHGLLVKAWETKVFPKIQRRFRNDQERKSGLEQIRGALQLGMESIAQETVEFLYEENGGLPKDLYFPTIDDVKADLEKFTIKRVKKGSAVVILKEFPYSRCGVRAMQKTQGLTGIVLSVDEPNELVQVECYIPSDGALVRFWYPVVYLERPPKGYRKPSALRGAESVNILVHRELLHCELSLAAMYCRSSLITLHAPSVSLPSPISVPFFLSLVACHNFSQPSVEGLCVSTSPSLSPSLTASVACVLSSPQAIFYSEPKQIEKVCGNLLENPPKDLGFIVSEVCSQLSNLSEGLGQGEFCISESKESMDVSCPKGSFMVVSSAEEKPKSDSKATYKYPWAKVFIYRGGQGKAGQMPLQEVIRYPNEIPQSNIHQYCGPTHPCHILPTNRLHFKIGGCSPLPGRLLNIVGIPELLPLVMSLADLLSRKIYHLHSVVKKTSGLELFCNGLSSCLLPLVKTICRLDCPPVLKERVFQTLSNTLWTFNTVQLIDSSTHLPALPSEFLKGITQELENVYEFESALFTSSKSKKFPPEGSISAGGLGKFSTYFQTLLEIVLASQQYMSLYHAKPTTTPATPDPKKPTKKDSPPPKNKSWLKYVTRITSLLQRLVQGRPIDREFYNLFKKSLPVRPETKILVVTGISTELEKDIAIDTITKTCNRYGGIASDGLYLPCSEKEVVRKLEDGQPEPEGGEKATDEETKPEETPEKEEKTPRKVTKLLATGGAVIELNSSEKASAVRTALLSIQKLQGEKKDLSVSTVNQDLKCGEDKKGGEVLREYLHGKLFEGKVLKKEAKSVLSNIFNMARYDNGKVARSTLEDKSIGETLLRLLVLKVVGDRDSKKMLQGICEGKKGVETISETKLYEWIGKEAKRDVRSVWCGLFAAGYDLHYQRCGFLTSEACICSPDSFKDHALALHVDSVCRKLGVLSTDLQPWDITLTDTDLASERMVPLQGDSLANIRLRFLQLKQFNRQLSWLLPLIELCSTHPASLGSYLSEIGKFLFYDTKISFLHLVLNSSTRRSLDQAPPEIKMDPLETVGGLASSAMTTQFCQAARQMLSIPSPQLCVSLASGGDPTYAFNVKLAGEEVHGTSGSFRHFLWQVVRELQSPLLPLLSLCPSHSAGINKGKHILASGPMGYSEEKMLEFLGQLLGVAIRADVPVAIDLLECFWKGLKGEELTVEDLKEVDAVTYSLTQKLIEVSDEAAFNELVDGIFHNQEENSNDENNRQPRFVYQNMKGFEEEICKGGNERELNFSNRIEYANGVRSFRLREIACVERMTAVCCGMASVIPIQLLRVLTAEDLNLRVCGIPDVDLHYLKLHTTYHVGLMEEDQHIKFFWNALETFSQEELRKFIKFACNQERIPFGQPCRGGTETVTNVPPYPMKIAPPDGTDPPNSRYIRAETCMFLVKLPQYSSQELMTERLKYAINCREDPLSG